MLRSEDEDDDKNIVKITLTRHKIEALKMDSFIIRDNSLQDKVDEKISKVIDGKNAVISYQLLYRGTQHQFDHNTFIEKCEYKGPTLTIVQSNV